MATWLAGLDVMPPGICEATRWVAGSGGVPSSEPAFALAGAAVKTGAPPHTARHLASHHE